MADPVFILTTPNPLGLSDVDSRANSTFVDIDGDSDLDGFVNNVFFENKGIASNPIFAAGVTNPFGLRLGDKPAFVDIDGDGDFDGFAGEYHGSTLFFRNTGTASSAVFAAPETNPFGLRDMSGYSRPAFIDIDDDGDLDVFVGSGHYTGTGGTTFFRNIGTVSNPVFYVDSFNPFGLNGGGYVSPTFVDIDGDNDFDAFLNTHFYQNTGIGSTSSFSQSATFGLGGLGFRPAPTFVDIDGDGDLDAFVGKGYYYGDEGGDTLFFENTGTIRNPVFIAPEINPFGLGNVGSFSNPAFVDIDGDHDLDAFVGNEAGNTEFFRNIGTINNPVFSAALTNPFGLSNVGDFASLAFVDIDADGDFDAYVNNMFFQNTGTASSAVFASPEINPFGSDPTFVDVDRDGDFDALTGGLFMNTGTVISPVFSYEGRNPFAFQDHSDSRLSSRTFVDIDGDGDLDNYITSNYRYGGVRIGFEEFVINNHAPNVANLTASETYTKNTPLNLTDIVISDLDSANVNATLTLSNHAAGSLNTATSGAVTSTFNAGTGKWTASGALADVNILLAGLIFTPAFNFNGAFTINTSISDGVAAPLLGSKNFSVLLVSTPGNNILTGTSFDNDTVTYASATAAVTVSLNIATQQNTLGAGLDTLTSVENLIGSAFNDNLTGNAANNVLDGRAGNDILSGWSGADTLIGGLGNDTYFVENPKDVVLEKPNQGTDTVSSRLTYTLPVNVENLILTGTAAVNGTGNSLNNIITGNNAANQLNGDAGNDTLNGGAGDDTLIGWSGADTMAGGLGNDTYLVENAGDVVTENLNQGIDTVSSRLTYTLPVNVENLTLTGSSVINGTGNSQANSIIGNAANNILNGGAGNDTLDGKTGNNVLTGGTGNDVFKFTTLGHIDTIMDYNVVNDTIQLENAVFTTLTTTGTLAAGQFRIGTQAVDANDFIIYNNATGALLYDANGNGAGAAVQIATIGVGLAMTNAEFVII